MQAVQTTKAIAVKNDKPTEAPIPAVAATDNGAAVATAPPPDEMTERILNRLLRMADNYRSSGSLWQAEEMYHTLMDEHEGTPQAEQARKRLLDLCEAYELDGQLHHARSLYERLL